SQNSDPQSMILSVQSPYFRIPTSVFRIWHSPSVRFSHEFPFAVVEVPGPAATSVDADADHAGLAVAVHGNVIGAQRKRLGISDLLPFHVCALPGLASGGLEADAVPGIVAAEHDPHVVNAVGRVGGIHDSRDPGDTENQAERKSFHHDVGSSV